VATAVRSLTVVKKKSYPITLLGIGGFFFILCENSDNIFDKYINLIDGYGKVRAGTI
jgi:hypothetical protein